jgi:hypothetical protein
MNLHPLEAPPLDGGRKYGFLRQRHLAAPLDRDNPTAIRVNGALAIAVSPESIYHIVARAGVGTRR